MRELEKHANMAGLVLEQVFAASIIGGLELNIDLSRTEDAGKPDNAARMRRTTEQDMPVSPVPAAEDRASVAAPASSCPLMTMMNWPNPQPPLNAWVSSSSWTARPWRTPSAWQQRSLILSTRSI